MYADNPCRYKNRMKRKGSFTIRKLNGQKSQIKVNFFCFCIDKKPIMEYQNLPKKPPLKRSSLDSHFPPDHKNNMFSARQLSVFFMFCFVLIVGVAATTLQAAKAPASDGNVILENTAWNQVRIQVRIGNNQNVESNPQVDDVTLLKGQSKSYYISGSNSVYFRRKADPDNPNSEWRTWTHMAFPGKTNID